MQVGEGGKRERPKKVKIEESNKKIKIKRH